MLDPQRERTGGGTVMLKQIRGTRLSLKTTILVIVLALIVWALVVFVNVRDFVPAELQTSEQTEP